MAISEITKSACREVFAGKGDLSIKIDEEAGRCQAKAAKAAKVGDAVALHAALVALASVIKVLSARSTSKNGNVVLGLASAAKWYQENMNNLEHAIACAMKDFDAA